MISWALDESKVFIISSISFLVTWNQVILAIVLCKKDGKILKFCIGVHIDENKLLKRFSFLQKSGTNLPSTNIGGIAGIFYYRLNYSE